MAQFILDCSQPAPSSRRDRLWVTTRFASTMEPHAVESLHYQPRFVQRCCCDCCLSNDVAATGPARKMPLAVQLRLLHLDHPSSTLLPPSSSHASALPPALAMQHQHSRQLAQVPILFVGLAPMPAAPTLLWPTRAMPVLAMTMMTSSHPSVLPNLRSRHRSASPALQATIRMRAGPRRKRLEVRAPTRRAGKVPTRATRTASEVSPLLLLRLSICSTRSCHRNQSWIFGMEP